MTTRLGELIAAAREQVADRKRRLPPDELRARLGPARGGRPFRDALAGPGLSLIAEFKRRSPSAGAIRAGAGVGEVVRAYERGGAAALSVLTEERSFGGSLDDLREAREASALPILRKDFVVDPYQVHEAAASGADAVLLIVAALDDATLRGLCEEAGACGLDSLVEVHDEAELDRALAIDAPVVGVNNRDLRTLSVDIETTTRLLARLPAGTVAVAESGYERREQLAELEASGAAGVLVGETLMRAADPGAMIAELVG